MTQFQQLGVQPWLAKQCAYMALHHPTPIQQRCIPAILGGRHVVGGAATGSGKTAAFALPILQTLANDTYGVYALVLTPSRELAYQIIDQFITFGAPLQVRTMLAIGGVAIEAQIDALKARPHVVAATPGRLHHLLQMFGPEVKRAFAHLRYLVLDEADRLTEGDMQQDVWSLLRLLPPAMKTRQVLMFTATLHPRLTSLDAPPAPETTAAATTEDGAVPVSVLGELGITDPKTMEVVVVKGAIQENASATLDAATGDAAATASALTSSSPTSTANMVTTTSTFHVPETLQQHYLFIPNMVKLPYLVAALRAQGKNQSTIVYVNSCMRAELVRLTLQLLGFPVCSLDSLLTQQHRLDNVASFKLGIARILVCTDIAARGLDIPLVGLVIHYDVPKQADTYVHRVGRTARAGREGHSVALVTEYDVNLIERIEKRTRTKLVLWRSPAATESAILPLLDEVSSAKVQAKQQVSEQFGDRVQTNKAHAARKREARAERQAAAMAHARERREHNGTLSRRRTSKQKRNSGEEEEEAPQLSASSTSSPSAPPTPVKRVSKRARTSSPSTSADLKMAEKPPLNGASTTASPKKRKTATKTTPLTASAKSPARKKAKKVK